MKILGKILWVSKRDGNGIIRDKFNKEYYFDSSVVKDEFNNYESGMLVEFTLKDRNSCRCAVDVSLLRDRDQLSRSIFNKLMGRVVWIDYFKKEGEVYCFTHKKSFYFNFEHDKTVRASDLVKDDIVYFRLYTNLYMSQIDYKTIRL